LRASSIKIFYDGLGLARAALMYEDWCREYEVDRGNKGLRLISISDLVNIIRLANREDLGVDIYAISDRAIDKVVKSNLNCWNSL